MAGFEFRVPPLAACPSLELTLTRDVVAPDAVAHEDVDRIPFVSPATRLEASESNAT